MNTLGIPDKHTLVGVDSQASLITSPSVSTFLPEEDVSTCLLLPATPSPPSMDFIHPLTPNAGIGGNLQEQRVDDDAQAETSSSSGSSSGIGIQVSATAASNLFHKQHAYQHLGKNGDIIIQENGVIQNGLTMPPPKGTPSFVTWNWPIIRKCTFIIFISFLLGMCGIVVAMIYAIPKTCNPVTPWYKGRVFYEIFPASFQDSNGDGIGDLKGLARRVDYLKNLGIAAIRLNSIFPTHQSYPEHYQSILSILEIDKVLGTKADLENLSAVLHEHNIQVVLDLPIFPYVKQFITTNPNISDDLVRNSNDSTNDLITKIARLVNNEDNIIIKALEEWIACGVDGFYVKGLENFSDDPYLVENIKHWKNFMGKNRVFIISQDAYKKFNDADRDVIKDYIDLIDVYLDVSNGTEYIAKQISKMLHEETPGISDEKNPWVHWTLGGVSEKRLSTGLTSNATLAVSLMQLMLPGTPSIFYGDEISLQEAHDTDGDHRENKHLHHLPAMAWNSGAQFTNQATLPWLPRAASAQFQHLDYIATMVALRTSSPSIYKNGIHRESQFVINTAVRSCHHDVIILERWYPRRNTFISVTNFNNVEVKPDLSSMFYSGIIMLGQSMGKQIFFNDFVIGPMETLIFKLDK